jgi:hypothetical protein
VRELASDALDELLEPDVQRRFHAHLESCPACLGFFGELRDSLSLLAELPEIEASPDFERRVLARVREEEPVGVRERLVLQWEALVDRLSLGAAPWRLAPLGVAAAIVGVIAFSSGPMPGELAPVAGSGPEGSAPVTSPVPGAVASVAEDPFVVSAAEVEPEEFEASMPRAIEEFLRNAPELRLPNPESYRDANYRYPMGRVRDPVGMVPVTGQARVGIPVSQPEQPASGVMLLSF